MQLPVPPTLMVPAGHVKQAVPPATGWNVPAPHATHEVAVARIDPMLHGVQALALPVLIAPGGHAIAAADPVGQ